MDFGYLFDSALKCIFIYKNVVVNHLQQFELQVPQVSCLDPDCILELLVKEEELLVAWVYVEILFIKLDC